MLKYTGPRDYFAQEYVEQWAREANRKRPFREEIFAAFTASLKTLLRIRVLDLGSGPGFLAERVLNECDIAAYHLFDFSPLMLDMSRERLARFADRARFHQGSFAEDGWCQRLPAPFDAVVSLQAVHEVRNSKRIARLYSEIFNITESGGIVLIADKINDESDKEEHHLTAAEHVAALGGSGFESVRTIISAGDLALFYGERP
jgi:SAM-dependent methyltransferase